MIIFIYPRQQLQSQLQWPFCTRQSLLPYSSQFHPNKPRVPCIPFWSVFRRETPEWLHRWILQSRSLKLQSIRYQDGWSVRPKLRSLAKLKVKVSICQLVFGEEFCLVCFSNTENTKENQNTTRFSHGFASLEVYWWFLTKKIRKFVNWFKIEISVWLWKFVDD